MGPSPRHTSEVAILRTGAFMLCLAPLLWFFALFSDSMSPMLLLVLLECPRAGEHQHN